MEWGFLLHIHKHLREKAKKGKQGKQQVSEVIPGISSRKRLHYIKLQSEAQRYHFGEEKSRKCGTWVGRGGEDGYSRATKALVLSWVPPLGNGSRGDFDLRYWKSH
jgi:hypothetical protein